MHQSLSISGTPTLALAMSLMTAIATVPVASSAQQQAPPNVVQLESEEEVVRRYSVEVIVFEYAGTAANTTEIFEPEPIPELPSFLEEGIDPDAAPVIFSDRPVPTDPAEPLPVAIDPADDEALMLEPGEEAPFALRPGEALEEIPTYENAGIELIDPAEYQLTAAWEKLVNLDAYRPLMHTAWIQPTVEKAATLPLPVRRLGDPPLRLDGAFTLYLSRFLHLVVDLSLEQRPSQSTTAGRDRIRYYGNDPLNASPGFGPEYLAPSTTYRINEDRIVRNDEVRYYDHPKFGVIARVARIEEELPEGLDTTDDLLPGNPVQ